MDCCSSDGSPTIRNHAHRSTHRSRCQTQLTIDTLPDDALLYVFDFYVAQEAWNTLVHVCRRWRNLVFASPRRLHLQIACTSVTPVEELLDVWPGLPIAISGSCGSSANIDNVNAAFKHHDRVCQIRLRFVAHGLKDALDLEDIFASLGEPFPMLTDLKLDVFGYFRPFEFDPDPFKFSATRLRSLTLSGVPIPDLPKLLLSTPNLIILRLYEISIHDPVDEIVTGLSALTRLEQLDLPVAFRRSHHDRENRRLPLLTRTVLPSLTVLGVTGATEDLEEFMARIDAPLLDHLYILFTLSGYNRVMLLDTPHLFQFISRIPRLLSPDGACMGFGGDHFKVWINFKFFCSTPISRRVLRLEISGVDRDWEFPCLAQFCRSAPFPLRPLEYLCIGEGRFSHQYHRNHARSTRWLELLQPFAAVKNLYLTNEFSTHVAHALQDLIGERVLPALENVFIEDDFWRIGPFYEAITEFVAARQLTGHTIIISQWDMKKRPATQVVDNRFILHRMEATHWLIRNEDMLIES